MGASSATRAKSPTNQNDVEQQQQQRQRPPNLNVQDIENNNNHIFINPHERFYALIDECDLLNNNTTLINGNYLTVSLSPSNTTNTGTALRFSHLATAKTSPNCNQSAKSPLAVVGCKKVTIESTERKKNMQNKESPKKSPKKQLQNENEKKKKKKEKPKAPRAPNASGNVGRGRGMAEQDQLMRRPRRKLKDKEEKYESFYLLLSHSLFYSL
ncbi:hypothetical protein PVAND_013610 [Polypedilum vanderplanki]|uniref:Uncharacterized protein n=1 Tax=Polypedilum vanderplanki TaxID=319348 RepID=A0A9J6CR80_POLVA|nr:hypothetical protein PVAND_013610 [Polypedilum vanderplanki]